METGTVILTTNALMEFASCQIGTIDGELALHGPNPRVADAGTLATNSALTGLNTVAGDFRPTGGASVSTTGGLSITGNGDVVLDPYYDNGSSLALGGTLINSSASGGALLIGNGSIGSGDTVTAAGLSNTSVIDIRGTARSS